jgi:S-formylglutathione hydrolase FrmB
MRYETYYAKELIDYIDNHYPTINDPKGRGILGLSMGGHGAFYLALKHQDKYGAAGSMSGGVDFLNNENKWKSWGLPIVLGPFTRDSTIWKSHTVVNMLDLYKTNSTLQLNFDCGLEDQYFVAANRLLHCRLLAKGINHNYAERPGMHHFTYWQKAIQYQMIFFSNYFNGYNPDTLNMPDSSQKSCCD